MKKGKNVKRANDSTIKIAILDLYLGKKKLKLFRKKEKEEKVGLFLHHFQIKERKRRQPKIKNTSNIY